MPKKHSIHKIETSSVHNCDMTDSKWFEIVDANFKNATDDVILNGRVEHARHLIRHIVMDADKEVWLCTGSLCNEMYVDNDGFPVKESVGIPPQKMYAYQPLLDAFGAFLAKKGSKLNIIIEGEERFIPEEKLFLASPIIKPHHSQISIKQYTQGTGAKLQHFMVNDKNAYRVESLNSVAAVANANEPESAKIIREKAQEIFKSVQHTTEIRLTIDC